MLRRTLIAAAIALAALSTSSTTARAASDMDFTLVNATGYDIKEVYVSPSAAKDWGANILKGLLKNNDGVAISFHPTADSVEKWDLMVAWTDGSNNSYWEGFKLSEINKITLKYNKQTDVTTAVTE